MVDIIDDEDTREHTGSNPSPISNNESAEMDSSVEQLLGLDLKFQALYKMKEQIGKGSYGTVWTAWSVSEPEKVYAVKVIDRSKLKKKDVDSVFREVEILNELQDLPHVIPLIEFVQDLKSLYVVQFYAKGGDLFRRLSERQVFTEKDARDIAVTLFETLEVMHVKHKIVSATA
jgi:calcium/calmodulin-dependent protein kinase I